MQFRICVLGVRTPSTKEQFSYILDNGASILLTFPSNLDQKSTEVFRHSKYA
mgnify:CR=1 FL=1